MPLLTIPYPLRIRRDDSNTRPAARHAAAATMSAAASTVLAAVAISRAGARPATGLVLGGVPLLALSGPVHRAAAAAVTAGPGLLDNLVVVAGVPRPVRGLDRGGLPGGSPRVAGDAVAPG